MAVIAVGILIFCDHREQKFSTLMVERGVLGFPKHNLAPSSKHNNRHSCLSILQIQNWAHPTNPVEGCADANPKTVLPNDT